ncbi:MAG: AAA family ATPase [Propionibacteriaceae bacterium]|nr:AAA family ATPase [Propionibacteriaceae bacterium]
MFERAVDSLHLRSNVDLYLTGSNAHLLSGDLATLISGRHVGIAMLPFSFAEFVERRRNDPQVGADLTLSGL